ncbi:type VI secretion system-associated protein TagF [Halomonas heilongjiangensis]|uniref:Type VI secretion system-associated protein TagF n=1 Tax=Halomonas heilongjiangensis TaxID=1387883 RepID=A0A2N7TFR4_9GAMM|nr:type VI secretion system-associated protein TagF [Halomonas heilongjiangensis]PMR67026.1 type VI secretion system-associated protein TagF [Halomonas heilongjiangensis]PXX88058.1 type VI secretion system-associated protein TagF [Halomonas heilongjiangensis]
MAGGITLGFHGKLPCRGDFVRRRVAGDFLSAWDPWLSRCMHDSHRLLGEGWLDAYLTSPLWRFAVSAGVCGEKPATGLLMPSVDAVGRYYPLTLVGALPAESSLFGLAVQEGAWFEELEALAMSVLEDDPAVDLEQFDLAVSAHGARLQPWAADAASRLLAPLQGPTCFALESLEQLVPALLAMQQALLGRQQGFSLWWTEGSRRIPPCLLLQAALPVPERFAAMFDGEWQHHGWESRVVRWQAPRAAVRAAPSLGLPRLSSASVSHAGKVREVNEDACLDRPDLRLWAVADGVGGHEAGDEASRSVIDGLQQAPHSGELQERVNALHDVLVLANRHLWHAAHRPERPVTSASTVVVLLTGVEECCWLWAGDSRLYRLRDGQLSQCTRDHSVVQDLIERGELEAAEASTHPQANVITRAVGAAAELDPESRFSDLRSGDRFLLCSDGVHGCVAPDVIQSALQGDSPREVVDTLLRAVLEGEARDNCTAVAVFVD